MSYSFNVKAASKAAAKEEIAAKFAEVVNGQPVHKADHDAAVAAAQAFVDVLAEPNDEQIVAVTVNGWVSWRAEDEFIGASVSINAGLATKA